MRHSVEDTFTTKMLNSEVLLLVCDCRKIRFQTLYSLPVDFVTCEDFTLPSTLLPCASGKANTRQVFKFVTTVFARLWRVVPGVHRHHRLRLTPRHSLPLYTEDNGLLI